MLRLPASMFLLLFCALPAAAQPAPDSPSQSIGVGAQWAPHSGRGEAPGVQVAWRRWFTPYLGVGTEFRWFQRDTAGEIDFPAQTAPGGVAVGVAAGTGRPARLQSRVLRRASREDVDWPPDAHRRRGARLLRRTDSSRHRDQRQPQRRQHDDQLVRRADAGRSGSARHGPPLGLRRPAHGDPRHPNDGEQLRLPDCRRAGRVLIRENTQELERSRDDYTREQVT